VWDAWQSSVSVDVMATSLVPSALLHERQRQRLASLLASAAQGSRLFKRIVGKRDPQRLSLHELPVLQKAELMERFDDWVTDPRLTMPELRRFLADPRSIGAPYLGQYHVWESSGSSGEPGAFVQDAPALAVYDALEAIRRPVLQPMRRWCDPWYLNERLAFVGATTGHFASTVTVRRLCRVNPWMESRLRSFSFLQPLPALLRQLEEQSPTVLATYPTVALMLAEQAAAGRLQLELKEVWTGGESLTPAMRAGISRSFGCPVAQSYGASEFLSLASECRCRRLHLNSDWALLESVDEHHRPVPAGEPGSTTLLTNLANRVQPIIRYELGDRIVLHDTPCECGSVLPVIEVQGRVDDSVVLDDAAGHAVRLPPLALTTVLEDEAGVFDFRLLQAGRRSLRLELSGQGEEVELQLRKARRALSHYLRGQGLAGVKIDGQCGVPCPRGRSGKVQRVVAHAM
jgi:phenylacetate-CoA ligase